MSQHMKCKMAMWGWIKNFEQELVQMEIFMESTVGVLAEFFVFKVNL